MDPAVYQRIERNPKFQELVASRGRFAWTLTILVLIIYFGFILLVAFAPGFLGQPIGEGPMTVGIPLGILVIISAFLLTGIYVSKANSSFDQLTTDLLKEVK